MRMRRAFGMRSTAILLLAATLLWPMALPGHTGAHATGPSGPTQSSGATGIGSLTTEGGRIAFSSGKDIYLINADGTGLTQLTYSDSDVYNYQPALSPDGTRVAFATFQGSQAGISIIDVDGSGLRTLTTNNLTRDTEPAWAPDGSKIAFVRGFDPTSEGVANLTDCGPVQIYVIDVDGVFNPIINLTPDQNATDPAWSPDGTRIAFASNQYGNYDIYSMTSEGTDVQRLTWTDEQEAEPTWSPDGKSIAYASGYVGAKVTCGFIHTPLTAANLSHADIYSMSSDGNNQIRLTETESNIEPTWSPDGPALAFVNSYDGAYEICVLDYYHKTPSCITSDTTFKSSPSWSRADPRVPSDSK